MQTDRSLDDEVDTLMRSLLTLFASTSGLEETRAYFNYAHGDEGPETWYGAGNLERLVKLKQQWDPTGAFGKAYPLPLSL